MTDTTTTIPPDAVAPAPVDEAPAPPGPPVAEVAPAPAHRPSRAWMGVVVLFVAVATLAGATIALFVRVQDAQKTADDAIVIAGNQDALNGRIDQLDTTLASIQTDGAATADDLAAARDQVGSLRKCVNNAIDSWAQATQTGKPTSVTKC
jgi:hypothetical protein